MVTDLQGVVQYQGSDRVVSILDNLEIGALITIKPEARLTLVYLETGNEFIFNSASIVEISLNMPKVIKGKPAKKNELALTQHNIHLSNVNYATAVMRGNNSKTQLNLLTPTDTALLGTSPVFHWDIIYPDSTYSFRLMDQDENTLYKTHIQSNHHSLPDNVSLKYGQSYTWEITTSLANGRRLSNFADFNIVDSSVKDRLIALKPRQKSSFSQRVVYATVLEQHQCRDEAGELWRELARLRPGNPNLKKKLEL